MGWPPGAAGVEWTRVRKCAFIETPRKTDDLGRLVKDGFVLNSGTVDGMNGATQHPNQQNFAAVNFHPVRLADVEGGEEAYFEADSPVPGYGFCSTQGRRCQNEDRTSCMTYMNG
jgi:hypothetical protein